MRLYGLTLTATTAPFQVALYTRPELPCKAQGRLRAVRGPARHGKGPILLEADTCREACRCYEAAAEKDEQALNALLAGARALMANAMAVSVLGQQEFRCLRGTFKVGHASKLPSAAASLLILASSGPHTASNVLE